MEPKPRRLNRLTLKRVLVAVVIAVVLFCCHAVSGGFSMETHESERLIDEAEWRRTTNGSTIDFDFGGGNKFEGMRRL